jgi:signal recognition particle subunit SRP54
MFENLSDRLQGVFAGLRSKGRLTPEDIESAMREIRLALLEADVNFKVVKSFVAAVKEKALTADVLDSLTPAQNVVRIVLDQLTELLGTDATFALSSRIPNILMLVGLQGSGKTTAAAKLAWRLKSQGHSPLLVACDVYRPAAADQLEALGREIDVRVFRGDGAHPVGIAETAVREAIDSLRDVVIIDTAGRLHIDEEMMAEAVAIRDAVKPDQILMVVDAMTGQDVVNVAAAFAERVDFDGVIMAKMDGDARGGGALSIRAITGKPIKFISEGEKPSSLEEFHPDRMAKRILGMGDVVTLIEKAQAVADEEFSQAEAERLARAELTFEDFLAINRQVRKIGGLSSLLKALPGGEKALGSGQVDEGALDHMEVIIHSMTKQERLKPSIINGSRRARIAAGAGVQVREVNGLLTQFNETRKMMKRMQLAQEPRGKGKKGKKGRRGAGRGLRGMGGMGGMGGKGGMGGMGGMGGLSPADLKGLEDLLK